MNAEREARIAALLEIERASLAMEHGEDCPTGLPEALQDELDALRLINGSA